MLSPLVAELAQLDVEPLEIILDPAQSEPEIDLETIVAGTAPALVEGIVEINFGLYSCSCNTACCCIPNCSTTCCTY
jgi:hypothetical protein